MMYIGFSNCSPNVFNVWICSLMYPIYGNINIKTRLIAGISYWKDNQQPSLAFNCVVNAKKAQRLSKV